MSKVILLVIFLIAKKLLHDKDGRNEKKIYEVVLTPPKRVPTQTQTIDSSVWVPVATFLHVYIYPF